MLSKRWRGRVFFPLVSFLLTDSSQVRHPFTNLTRWSWRRSRTSSRTVPSRTIYKHARSGTPARPREANPTGDVQARAARKKARPGKRSATRHQPQKKNTPHAAPLPPDPTRHQKDHES